MTRFQKAAVSTAAGILLAGLFLGVGAVPPKPRSRSQITFGPVTVQHALKFDVSKPLASMPVPAVRSLSAWCANLSCGTSPGDAEWDQAAVPAAPKLSAAGIAVEQTSQGHRPALPVAQSFNGLGVGFKGPQGTGKFRNPSDNSLAVGPNDIVQIVNARFAVYTKKGKRYKKSGKVLYGPVPTNEFFHGFGGPCAARDNGDAVVRYDQLAGRWLVVMPLFRPIQPHAAPAASSHSGKPAPAGKPSVPGAPMAPRVHPPHGKRTFGVCFALSVGKNPLGPYYRYAFARKNFPDYPRPAVWPDGYYVATSSGDHVIQKQVCIVDRAKMLEGQPATEQCIVVNGVNFLNNADIDGHRLPPPGAPNIMMAAGGTQLKNKFSSHWIHYWKVHVNWKNPSRTRFTGKGKIRVAPYHYLCNGQLTHCVPQPGTNVRLDAQGDKIMQRLVYRRIGKQQDIVAAQSVDTSEGGGGVRWYEFRINRRGNPALYQQGTYAPDRFYRWMPSIDIDRMGDIGIGYSFGGTPYFPGQRFAARKAGDPKGKLTYHETVLVNGQAAQEDTFRWEDYTTTAMDPGNGCTFWYVGDYLKKSARNYSTRIGAFRVPGCVNRK